MDASTLSKAMGGSLSLARYEALLPAFNAAMVAAGITTPLRAAHWCAQIGHESAGLRYMEEIATGYTVTPQLPQGAQGCDTSKATSKRWKVTVG